MAYTHLTEEERYQIDDLRRDGLNLREIAYKLGRSESTLSRELSRNKGKRGYRPRQAHLTASKRLTERGKANVKHVSNAAINYAVQHLKEDQWSPEQIANRIKMDCSESISHEAIYQYVLDDKISGGSLYTHLRCKKKRKKRYGASRSARGKIPNRVGIEKRPAIVEDRNRTGDWEGDTIIGSHDGGAVIASMVERKSRFTVLVKAKNKSTACVIGGINDGMRHLSTLVHTITLDNGKEFSHHEKMANALNADVYFAQPYHSWERGLNENTNGLVRQYFPKKVPFDNISRQELQRVVYKLNNRPRKCLGYKTPFEVFSRSCARKGIALRI